VLCSRVRHSRSSKVVDFGTNRKGVATSIVTLGLSCAVSELGRVVGENREFFRPHCHLTPSLRVNPLDFLDVLFIAKTRVLGLSVGKRIVILSCVVLTHCQHVTDRQTDNSTVYIASSADAL